jgi:hypothetical protein
MFQCRLFLFGVAVLLKFAVFNVIFEYLISAFSFPESENLSSFLWAGFVSGIHRIRLRIVVASKSFLFVIQTIFESQMDNYWREIDWGPVQKSMSTTYEVDSSFRSN